jgi:hypothetical protein
MEELVAVLNNMTWQEEGNVEGNIGDNHEVFTIDPDCCNPSLGLTIKAKACKVVGQK